MLRINADGTVDEVLNAPAPRRKEIQELRDEIEDLNRRIAEVDADKARFVARRQELRDIIQQLRA